jgi:hypothetical protein
MRSEFLFRVLVIVLGLMPVALLITAIYLERHRSLRDRMIPVDERYPTNMNERIYAEHAEPKAA